MTNLGEIEGLTFVQERSLENRSMPGRRELVCFYSSQTGHIVALPRAAFNVQPPLAEVPPKHISILIRVED